MLPIIGHHKSHHFRLDPVSRGRANPQNLVSLVHDTVLLHFQGRRQVPSRSMELQVAESTLVLLGAMAVALFGLWIYRLVQSRQAVRRSQARWVAYEPAPVLTEDDLGLNWPSLKPILLSPIPEERHESGRVRRMRYNFLVETRS